MRNKMLILAAILFASLSSPLTLNVHAQEAARPVPRILPSAVKALSVTRFEWSSDDMVNIHLRNDSGRPILGFAIAHNEAEVERPAHDGGGYTVIVYLNKFEPNPLQPGSEVVVDQGTNEPIRPAAVLYEDGTVEGDRQACKHLLFDKKQFEDELTSTIADLRQIRGWAKTGQQLEKTLTRYIRFHLSGLHKLAIGGPPVSFPPSPPGLHTDAALMLQELTRENSPEAAVDEFIRLAEKRLGLLPGEVKKPDDDSSDAGGRTRSY